MIFRWFNRKDFYFKGILIAKRNKSENQIFKLDLPFNIHKIWNNSEVQFNFFPLTLMRIWKLQKQTQLILFFFGKILLIYQNKHVLAVKFDSNSIFSSIFFEAKMILFWKAKVKKFSWANTISRIKVKTFIVYFF